MTEPRINGFSNGVSPLYGVMLDGEIVFQTDNLYENRMFQAELKWRLRYWIKKEAEQQLWHDIQERERG